MGVQPFTHLHVHTEYSLLDGSSKIKELVKQAKDIGMDSLAITDHGVMYGVVDFYEAAKEVGVKPIIGCEVYVANRTRFDKETNIDSMYYHLILLAENQVGYHNLVKLVSAGFTEGFYYKPRVDMALLEQYSEGIIALSACLGGQVPSTILRGDIDEAKEVALRYQEIFGKGNFYLELQNHGYEEQVKVNRHLVEFSNELGIPLAATNDVHYTFAEDVDAHDILLCIQTNKKVSDKDRMRYEGGQFYLKSPEEMEELFGHLPEAITNTVKIAERCHVDFEFGQYKLPVFPLPESTDKLEYLKGICEAGLAERYPVVDDALQQRLDYELSVIADMGFVDYFLITWDFIKYARDNSIMVGPGRGSAAGSLVSYALKITDIDPIKYQLLFERFLNPERVSMPDIDIDFCYERRPEVIQYVIDKYGLQQVAQIITFGTMAARAVIRDVGRALDMPYNEVDRVAKLIPQELKITISKALKINAELKELYENDESIHYLIDMSMKLEGLPRHSSTHAAGVVICDRPVDDYVPLNTNDGNITTQFPMTTLERLGLLKMDFLGLRTLTVIQDAVAHIKSNVGIDVDMAAIDLEDEKVYELIGSGRTEGVFQLESEGMKNFMKELKPKNIEDIIAGISLYRPGPMEFIPEYIAGKTNPDRVAYDCEQLMPILKPTYGVIVYQEQVMQIVRDLAGYTLGRSDLVRRAMSKKKGDVMERERQNFIYGNKAEGVRGCINSGIDERTASLIYDKMLDFAKYAFNKSHAAAYAMIAYQTAWLKTYYPVEFMAALLTSVMFAGNKAAEYIYTLKSMGIDVLPPDINEGCWNFSVKGDSIRFGLAAVKNVGKNVINNMVEEREKNGRFRSLRDFAGRLESKDLNKRVIENLIRAGAFQSMGGTRLQYLQNYKMVLDSETYNRKSTISGQLNLFDMDEAMKETLDDDFPDVGEMPMEDILLGEKEVLGIYLSGHPLQEYDEVLKQSISHSSLDFQMDEEGTVKVVDGLEVIYGGIIAAKTVKTTRNNKQMAFLTVEDLFGAVEVVVFPNDYESNRDFLVEDEKILVRGRASVQEEQDGKIICKKLQRLDDMVVDIYQLRFRNRTDYEDKIKEVAALLKANPGKAKVSAILEEEGLKKDFGPAYRVEPSELLLGKLKDSMGSEGVLVRKSLLKL